MDSELFFKVSQREESVNRIKAFLVLPVAALHLAIMPGHVRTNEHVLDTKIKSSFLKKGLDVSFAVGKKGLFPSLTEINFAKLDSKR